MNAPITSFRNEHRWLSNFWLCSVSLDGLRFNTVENAYVAAKTLDLDLRRRVVPLDPGQAKRFGRTFVLRPDWDEVKLPTMRMLLEQKFASGYLRDRLLGTAGRELIEGNAWGDTFWGVCNGVGENHLGRMLMEIRDKAGAP